MGFQYRREPPTPLERVRLGLHLKVAHMTAQGSDSNCHVGRNFRLFMRDCSGGNDGVIRCIHTQERHPHLSTEASIPSPSVQEPHGLPHTISGIAELFLSSVFRPHSRSPSFFKGPFLRVLVGPQGLRRLAACRLPLDVQASVWPGLNVIFGVCV